MNITTNNYNNINSFTSHHRGDSFREKELYNDSKDRIAKGYSTYDGYDSTNSDFLNEELDTGNKTTEERLLNAYFNDYNIHVQHKPTISLVSTMVKENQDAVDLAMIKTKSGDKFSGNLYNHVREKLEEYPLEDVTKFTNLAKLKRNDDSEYVDYNLFEAGFKMKNNDRKPDSDKICDILDHTIEQDDEGNEVCNLSKLEYYKSAKKMF